MKAFKYGWNQGNLKLVTKPWKLRKVAAEISRLPKANAKYSEVYDIFTILSVTKDEMRKAIKLLISYDIVSNDIEGWMSNVEDDSEGH